MFGIITVVSVLGLLFGLSFYRFRNSTGDARKDAAGLSVAAYFSWLLRRISASFRISWIERLKKLYHERVVMRYPARERWIFIWLGVSFLYLAASGFLFSLLGMRLRGIFLLLHISLGGLFAVCLSAAVVLRARFHRFDTGILEGKKDSLHLQKKDRIRRLWQIILFWIFVAAGLTLILTALSQMLPSFALRTQLDFSQAHRYSALVSLLSAIALSYFSLFDDNQ